jgi:hypothetical protein
LKKQEYRKDLAQLYIAAYRSLQRIATMHMAEVLLVKLDKEAFMHYCATLRAPYEIDKQGETNIKILCEEATDKDTLSITKEQIIKAKKIRDLIKDHYNKIYRRPCRARIVNITNWLLIRGGKLSNDELQKNHQEGAFGNPYSIKNIYSKLREEKTKNQI